jgi:GTP-binding protein HflX
VALKCGYQAKSGAGLDLLSEAIATQLHGKISEETLLIKPSEAKLRAKLYQLDAVLQERPSDEGWLAAKS